MTAFHLQPPSWPGAPFSSSMTPPPVPAAPAGASYISWNTWDRPPLRGQGTDANVFSHSAWPQHTCSVHGDHSNAVPDRQNSYRYLDDDPIRWLNAPPRLPEPTTVTTWGKPSFHQGSPFRKPQQSFNNYHANRQEQGAAIILPWLLSMSLASPADIASMVPATPLEPGTGGDPNLRLQELFRWKQMDFAFPSDMARAMALANQDFIPENTLPLGLEVWKDRVFVTLPKWKTGIPATLATVPRDSNGDPSPQLKPYPDWSWHRTESQLRNGNGSSCDGLTSVFRMAIDPCGRLWVLDAGVVKITTDFQVVCPPQLNVFDLRTDQLLMRYVLPKSQVKEGSLFTNIAVDVRNGQCENAFAYMSDVLRGGIVVYSWSENNSWRVQHPFFLPDPVSSKYVLDGLTFRWTDGVFGIALGPVTTASYAEGGAPGPAGTGPQNPRPLGPLGPRGEGDRMVYFHAMSSSREFAVPASILLNGTVSDDGMDKFIALGQRGPSGQSSASAMDRRGVLFQNLVTRDAVGCWNSARPYTRAALGEVQKDHRTLSFPNDLKVDNEEHQNLWVLSNRLHEYLYRSLDPQDYNFRILTAPTVDATRGTICDPENMAPLPPVANTGCNDEP